MNYLRSVFSLKMVVVTLVTLYFLLAISCSSAYMGTRYGKREMVRSIGQRSIVNRGARFYPGSRYGGKRSYWRPTAFMSEEGEAGPESPSMPNSPYDCVYVPFVGVRCSRPEEGTNYWSNDEELSNGNGMNPSSSSSSSSSGGSVDQA